MLEDLGPGIIVLLPFFAGLVALGLVLIIDGISKIGRGVTID